MKANLLYLLQKIIRWTQFTLLHLIEVTSDYMPSFNPRNHNTIYKLKLRLHTVNTWSVFREIEHYSVILPTSLQERMETAYWPFGNWRSIDMNNMPASPIGDSWKCEWRGLAQTQEPRSAQLFLQQRFMYFLDAKQTAVNTTGEFLSVWNLLENTLKGSLKWHHNF